MCSSDQYKGRSVLPTREVRYARKNSSPGGSVCISAITWDRIPSGGPVALQGGRRGRGEPPGGRRPDQIRALFPPVPLDLFPVLPHLFGILERGGPDERLQPFAELELDRILDLLPKLSGLLAGGLERLRERQARLALCEVGVELFPQLGIHRSIDVVREHVCQFLAVHRVTPLSPHGDSGRAVRGGRDAPGAAGT